MLRYAVRVNGLTGVALTKLDVLDQFDSIKVCTGYSYNGTVLDELPSNLEIFSQCKPIYEELPGWNVDITAARRFDELPLKAQAYVKRLEELIGCPIVLVSVGPGRESTIILKNPFN